MTKTNEQLLDEIRNKVDENELLNRISKYDTIDLLSKVSCGSFFLRTDLFQNDGSFDSFVPYNDGIIFLTSLFMTKGIKGSDNKIKYRELSSLVKDISHYMAANSISTNDEIDTVAMSQKTVSEVLATFKGYYISTFLKAEDSVLKEVGIDADELIEDLHLFYTKMYDVDSLAVGKTFEQYINSFDAFNKSNFEYTGKYKEILVKLSSQSGEFEELYCGINPASSIDRAHCCFLNDGEKIYCFIPNLITAKLPKFLSHIIPEKSKETWFQKRKEWSEGSVRKVFETYFPGANIYQNNFYGTPNHRKENDVLVDFKGHLFIVEIKAENITPDSVFDDETKVVESFSKQILKGVEQCNTFYSFLEKNNTVELLLENNQKKNVAINYNDYDEVFKITVVFEEMGSYLPGFFVRNKNTNGNIVINFYDLLTVFDYLNNPILIIEYLKERRIIIPEECCVYDELVYLGMFTMVNIHYSSLIDNVVQKAQQSSNRIGGVFLPPDEFAREIEDYYTIQNSEKKEFYLNAFIRKVLNVDFKTISNRELVHLIAITDMDTDVHEKIEKSYNNPYSFAVLRFNRYDDETNYAICFKPTKKDCLESCAHYFQSHPELEEIVIVFFQKEKPKIMTIHRTNPELRKCKAFAGSWNRTLFKQY